MTTEEIIEQFFTDIDMNQFDVKKLISIKDAMEKAFAQKDEEILILEKQVQILAIRCEKDYNDFEKQEAEYLEFLKKQRERLVEMKILDIFLEKKISRLAKEKK